MEETLQKPANWEGSNSPEGVWSKIKKTVTGTPPSPTEKAQQTARDAVHATQKAADEAIRRAKQVPLLRQGQEVWIGLLMSDAGILITVFGIAGC